LVLAYEVSVILVDGEGGGDSYLRVLAHNETINIQTRLRFLFERALAFEPLEVLARLLVDLVRVDVRAHGQVYLGARDVQEARSVAFGERARLLCVDYVVRHGGDLRHLVGGRTQGAERVYGGHVASPPNTD